MRSFRVLAWVLFSSVVFVFFIVLSYLGRPTFSPLDPLPRDPIHFHYDDKNLKLCTKKNTCPTLIEWLHSEAAAGHEKSVEGLLIKGANVNGFVSDGTAAIHVAVARSHERIVKILLDAKADVNLSTVVPTEPLDNFIAPPVGWTGLHIAAMTGNESLLSILLEKGADVKATAMDGATPLHNAAEFGQEKSLKMLLASGADVNCSTTSGATPLLYAVNDGQIKICEILVKTGWDINAAMLCVIRVKAGEPINLTGFLDFDYIDNTPLWRSQTHAADRYHAAISELVFSAAEGVWVEKGRLLELEETQHCKIRNPKFCRIAAGILNSTSRDREKVLQLLLSAGVGLDAINDALLESVLFNPNSNITKILLEAGADVNIISKDGRSVLYQAAMRGMIKVVRTLIEAGANLNIRVSTTGQTPLHIASSNGYEKIVEELINAGAEIDAITMKGETPLHLTSSHLGSPRNLKTAKTLLLKGADPDLRMNDGRTPLHNVAETYSTQPYVADSHRLIPRTDIVEIVNLMLRVINAKSDNGETPLHCAASRGRNIMVKVLLNAGADPNSQNENGTTPIETARDFSVMELLLAAGALVTPNRVTNASLWLAATYEHIKILEILLERGWDPNHRRERLGINHNTPLHQAACVGNVKIVEMLLAAGANVTATNRHGETALVIAEKYGHKEVAKLLRKFNR